MESHIKHLEFIQTAINRMAGNSFLLKGWSVTLAGGLLALSFKEIDRRYLYVALAILGLFWLLDSYYLSRERGFVRLYNHVRQQPAEKTDFSMDIMRHAKAWAWLASAFSRTLLLFYGGVAVVVLIVNYYL
jgi:hypothetical protein